MQKIFDFFAAHRYLLWILLLWGVWGILGNTVFYRRMIYLGLTSYRRMREGSQLPPIFHQALKPIIRWSRKHYRAVWAWLPGLLVSIAVTLAATAGLIWL